MAAVDGDAALVLKLAKERGMTGEGWQWLAGDGWIQLRDLPQGVIGVLPGIQAKTAAFADLAAGWESWRVVYTLTPTLWSTLTPTLAPQL